MSFAIATTLHEALVALAAGARPIAGGSDLVVAARHGKAPLPESLIAIHRIGELMEITESVDGLRIGALVTHATLMAHPMIGDGYSGLADASALVGSPSTRNVGTIGGNVMNASPAMDTGAPLLVLGAAAALRSAGGHRLVALGELWAGPGRTTAAADELCVALVLPFRPPRSGSAYVRLEYRRAMEIAVVGAAAAVVLEADSTIHSVAVALTAVAPTIVAVSGLDELIGADTNDEVTLDAISAAAAAQASPISDLRASDRYRRHCVGVMARRAFEAASHRAAGEMIDIPVNRAYGIGAGR